MQPDVAGQGVERPRGQGLHAVSRTSHIDEMVVRIRGQRMYMWRAVDREGEALDVLVPKRRNKAVLQSV